MGDRDDSAALSWFPVAGEDQLDEYAQQVWAKCDERLGYVPNVFRAYAWRGERFERWLRYFNSVMRATETVDAAAREMIAVAVSRENGCLYCLAAHGYELRRALGDAVLGELISLDWRRAPLDDRHRAMLGYAVKVATEPLRCDRDDLEELHRHGFTDEDVWDIAEVAALYSSTNRMAMAAGFIPNACYHGAAREESP